MTAQDCLQILRTVKDAAFATVDSAGQPQVRIIDVMLVDEEKLYFCTARGKDFYRELVRDGRAAVTCMNRAFQMVRMTGTVRRLEDQKGWIDRIFRENPVMNTVYPGGSRYILEPFCMADAAIEFFDLGKSPIYRESFSIGTAEPAKRGFAVTSACIACGRCAARCPQQCIEEGTPFRIRQSSCLHCGLCYELCPAHAIERRSALTC